MRKKGASILLFDDEGKVLFQLRDDKAPKYPNVWAVFGGAMDPGETPEEAMKREAKEELNFDSKNPTFIGEYSYDDQYGGEQMFVFAEKVVDKSSLKLGEGADWGWYKLDEISQLPFAEHIFDMLQKLKEPFEEAIKQKD